MNTLLGVVILGTVINGLSILNVSPPVRMVVQGAIVLVALAYYAPIRSHDMTGSLLSIGRLTKEYPGVVALDAIDFDLAGGEVHAVVGHNGAGKSTLVKVIAGDIEAQVERFEIAGQPTRFGSPADAIAAGIRLVTQERSLVPPLSVAENILLGALPTTSRRTVDWDRAYAHAARVLDDLGVDLPLADPVARLRPAQQTLVEIAKALSAEARILLLDEPTSAITEQETEHLFSIVRRLRTLGVGIILISHRMADIVSIADRLTVLRDGRVVHHGPVAGLGARDIARVMSAEAPAEELPTETAARPVGDPVLLATSIASPGHLADVSIALQPGEILGVFGLVGSGAVELPYAIFGALPRDGAVRVNGSAVDDPAAAVAAGVGFVPADRSEGLFRLQSIARNVGAASMPAYTQRGVFVARKEQAAARAWIDRLAIVPPDPRRAIATFSGGNQQKALVGRWLERDVRILLLAEPTRGVDVAARAAIHALVRRLADDGVAVMVASTDLDEVVDLSDRIIVIADGEVVREFASGSRRDEVFHAAAA